MLYKLKQATQRGVQITAAIAIAVGTVLMPAAPAFADALNPLTERSLTLSSSAPGYEKTDGSGNSTYASPNSGANGHKSGNTFEFKVSTDSTSTPVKTMSFQYCTTSAGDCLAPGDDGFDGTGTFTRKDDDTTHSDLNVVTSSPAEVATGDFGTIVGINGKVQAIPQAGIAQNIVAGNANEVQATNNAVAGNYVVYYYDTTTSAWVQSTGWDMAVANVETGTVAAGTGTGRDNYIILSNSTGLSIPGGTQVRVVFFANDTNYITNPGSSSFFVKINTYNVDYDGTTVDTTALAPATEANIIDGGVTVANVMNHSISIQTKVLETMQFSVGTVDPNTLASGTGSALFDANGNTEHTTCDPVLTGMTPSDPVNVLSLGNQAAESSLAVAHTYSTHSYWRLSSNSSAGATVYYAGVTLSNTVGDKIDAIGAAKKAPMPGSEQFGLALTTDGGASYATNYDTEDASGTGVYENGADGGQSAGVDASVSEDLDIDGTPGSPYVLNASYHAPQLAPLVPAANYSDGAGVVNTQYGIRDTQFAFDDTSNLVPVPIATEDTKVVDCVTGRMRYVANIAATTPAGIYTTKVNYIAAPQY